MTSPATPFESLELPPARLIGQVALIINRGKLIFAFLSRAVLTWHAHYLD